MAHVDLREQKDRAPATAFETGPTLLVLRKTGYRTTHLAAWVPNLGMNKALCRDPLVSIGTRAEDWTIDRSGRPASSICNACSAEASAIRGIIRP